ncbi:hypothetical protein [Rhizorhabdus sp.]|uniref:hypothetical protein n=1 Tax=Rhizorhabdus sp. TaxID=1968843 RepID=UPI0035B2D2E5
MKPARPIDPTRRDWLRAAADLVGGNRALARLLDISDPSMSKYLTDGPNARAIPDGIVQDTRDVLLAHADRCANHAAKLIAEG